MRVFKIIMMRYSVVVVGDVEISIGEYIGELVSLCPVILHL